MHLESGLNSLSMSCRFNDAAILVYGRMKPNFLFEKKSELALVSMQRGDIAVGGLGDALIDLFQR